MRAAVEAEVARLGLGPRVRITGYVADDRLLAARVPRRPPLRPSERVRIVRSGPPRGVGPGDPGGGLAGRRDPGVRPRRDRPGGSSRRRTSRRSRGRCSNSGTTRSVGPPGERSGGPRSSPGTRGTGSWTGFSSVYEEVRSPVRIVQVTLRFDAPGGVETNVREVAKRVRGIGRRRPGVRERPVRRGPVGAPDRVRPGRRWGAGHPVPGDQAASIPGLTMPMWPGLDPGALGERGGRHSCPLSSLRARPPGGGGRPSARDPARSSRPTTIRPTATRAPGNGASCECRTTCSG